MALLLENEEQEIIDIRRPASLLHFLNYFSGMELSSPFLNKMFSIIHEIGEKETLSVEK